MGNINFKRGLVDFRLEAEKVLKQSGTKKLEELFKNNKKPFKYKIENIGLKNKRVFAPKEDAKETSIKYFEIVKEFQSFRESVKFNKNFPLMAKNNKCHEMKNTKELTQILHKRKREEIEEAYKKGVNDSVRIFLLEKYDDIKTGIIRIDEYLDWDGYSRRYGKPMIRRDHTIYAQLLSKKNLPGGSYDCEGLLTLAAEKISFQLWRAKWLKTGRAITENSVVEGYIFGNKKIGFKHADTKEDAKKLFKRSLKIYKKEEKRKRNEILQNMEHLHEEAKKINEMSISVEDARKAGYCPHGTEAFLQRNRIETRKMDAWKLLQLSSKMTETDRSKVLRVINNKLDES